MYFSFPYWPINNKWNSEISWNMTHIQVTIFKNTSFTLTDGIFETGAYGVPSKSQNPTVAPVFGPKQRFWYVEFLDPRHHLSTILAPSFLFRQVATDTTSYISSL